MKKDHGPSGPGPGHARRLLVAIGVTAAVAASSACAHVPPESTGRLAEVAVVDRDTGERLPIYWHQGRRYVAGTPGARYSIRIHNRAAGRVLAVVSVDGVNAVTGETASWGQSGYVFSPGERWEVRGWRKSAERVAAFEFTALPDSYAARTGRPDDVGVIGVAIFTEATPVAFVEPRASANPPAWPKSRSSPDDRPASDAGAPPRESSSSGASGPRAFGDQGNERGAQTPSSSPSSSPLSSPLSLSSPSQSPSTAQAPVPASPHSEARPPSPTPAQASRLGTGHGRVETSWVSWTQFERRRPTPDEVIAIHYDSRENLVAMGVIPGRAPRPFLDGLGFVPDPPR